MIVKTWSGSTYEFNEDRTAHRRVNQGGDFHALRRDEEWLPVIKFLSEPKVGESLRMLIDIRNDGIPTFRTTSEVTEIIND